MLTRIEIITRMLVTYLLYVFQPYSLDLSGYQQEEQEFLNRPVRRFRRYFSEFRVFVVLYIYISDLGQGLSIVATCLIRNCLVSFEDVRCVL